MSSSTFFFSFVPLLSFILLGVNLIFAPHSPYEEKGSVFECGYHSFLGQNRSQFSISFFIFAILFLLFDLEILLVYPYSVSGHTNGIYGLIIMLLFFLLLTLGFAFELGKKALNIHSRQVVSLFKDNLKKWVHKFTENTNINSQGINKSFVLYKRFLSSVMQYKFNIHQSIVSLLLPLVRCLDLNLRLFFLNFKHPGYPFFGLMVLVLLVLIVLCFIFLDLADIGLDFSHLYMDAGNGSGGNYGGGNTNPGGGGPNPGGGPPNPGGGDPNLLGAGGGNNNNHNRNTNPMSISSILDSDNVYPLTRNEVKIQLVTGKEAFIQQHSTVHPYNKHVLLRDLGIKLGGPGPVNHLSPLDRAMTVLRRDCPGAFNTWSPNRTPVDRIINHLNNN